MTKHKRNSKRPTPPGGRRQPTDRQAIFIAEYLVCLNAAEAARRAGYSKRSAGSIGCENLAKPEIRAEIERHLGDRVMGKWEVLARLDEIARGAGGLYIKADGSVDLAQMVKDGKGYLVKSIKPGKFGLTVEFHDAQDALVQLGRYYKLFTDRIEVHDWREEAQKRGLDPDAILQQVRELFAARLREGQAGQAGPETPGVTTVNGSQSHE